MRKVFLTAFVIAVLMAPVWIVAGGTENIPIAVSPGSETGVAAISQNCPTFSWSGVAWAQKYRVVVFGVEDERAKINGEMNLTAKPVLSEDIPGGGFSWTPSVSQGLASGADYVWYVGAMDGSGAWSWSVSRRFRIEESSKLAINEEEQTGLLEIKVKNEASKEKSLQAESGLSESKAINKNGAANTPEGPMGTEGTYSTFYGNNAGANNASDANYNSFFGSYAGYSTTTGYNNAFVGRIAGFFNTTGHDNAFLGFSAGLNNTTGNCNTFLGSSAGNTNTTGYDNAFIGYAAGYYNTTGNSNAFLGFAAGNNNTTGNSNVFLGYWAGFSNSSGGSNTFIGRGAGYGNTTAAYNTFVGSSAGYANSTGSENTFLGESSGAENTVGTQNVFVGTFSGTKTTTGAGNTFVGYRAGNNHIGGIGNIFLGSHAGSNETGSYKLYIDNCDTASPLIYGDFSTDMVGINGWLGVGTNAPAYPMELKTTGRNAAIVANRTDGAVNFVNATTSYGQFGTVNNFPIRLLANAIWRLTLNTDNSLAMASGATCTAGGVWQNASSRLLKENIVALKAEEAVTTLKGLNPVRFVYKADTSDEQVGFIAEDVPDLVATKDRKGMSAMDVVAVLTKVAQEQQQNIEELKREIAELKKKRSE